MYRIVIVLLLMFLYVSAESQMIRASGGLNTAKLYEFPFTKNDYALFSYPQFSYSFNAGVDQLEWRGLILGLGLNYSNYNLRASRSLGKFKGNEYSLSEHLNFQKQLIGFSVYPFQRDIVPYLRLSIGIQTSFLIKEEFSGSLHDFDSYSRRIFVGIIGNVSYTFRLSEKLRIGPSYFFYYGLIPEQNHTIGKARLTRKALHVQIDWKLK